MKSKKALKMLGTAVMAAAVFSNCFISLLGVNTAFAANTLAYGSFEELSVGDAISTSTNGVPDTYWAHPDSNKSSTVTDAWASDGTKSVAVVANSTGQAAINYQTRAEAGKTYTFSADIHVGSTAGLSGDCYVRIVTEGDNANSGINAWANRGISSDIAGANSGYITVSQTFTPEENYERVRLNVCLFADSTASVVQYVDNIRFTVAGDDEESTNLLTDGDFETLTLGNQLAVKDSSNLLEYFTTNAYGYVSDDKASSGSKSIKVIFDTNSSTGAQAGFNVFVKLEAGKTYRIAADVKIDDSAATSNPYIRFANLDADASAAWTNRGIYDVTAAKAGFVTASSTLTTTQAVEKARININFSGSQLSYIDNVIFEEVTEAEPTPTPTAEPTPTPTAEPTPTPTLTPEPGEGNKTSENKIINGTFESLAEGYTAPTGNSSVMGEIFILNGTGTVSADYAAEGSKSMKINGSASGAPSINAFVKMEKGKTYYASAELYAVGTLENTPYIRFANTDLGHSDTSKWGVYDATIKSGFVKVGIMYTAEKDYTSAPARINVSCSKGCDIYVDNFTCVEVGDPVVVKTVEFNAYGTQAAMPIVPTSATAKFVFSDVIDTKSVTAENITLNGNPVGTDLSITEINSTSVTIKLDNLEYNKVYTLSLGSDGWKDSVGRQLENYKTVFKTSGKIFVGNAALYDGAEEITDGALRTGDITARVTAMTNITDEKQTICAVMVLYKNGIIAERTVVPAELAAGEALPELTASITVPDISDGDYSLGFFVWDSISNGIALYDCINLS